MTQNSEVDAMCDIPRTVVEHSFPDTNRNHRESLLLRIPLEVRQIIYEYALPIGTWHSPQRYLSRGPGTAHFRHVITDGETRSAHFHVYWRPCYCFTPPVGPLPQLPRIVRNGLAMLLCCKQINNEAKHILLLRSKFNFHTIRTLVSWAGHPIVRYMTFAELQIDIKLRKESSMLNDLFPNGTTMTGWKERYRNTPVLSNRRFPALRVIRLRIQAIVCRGSPTHEDGLPANHKSILEGMSKLIEKNLNGSGSNITFLYTYKLRLCRHNLNYRAPTLRSIDWDGDEGSYCSALTTMRLEKTKLQTEYGRYPS
ncbi:unnamed protein product [Periconia digitata]|uniref:DUF7730 domain-containing protein n=1 Tax=Periconia digitata TaxID=1303443 RepID=A0A9W4TZ53_9PLEO|nr:unnamed protein product [Periconia digitata]